MMGRRGPGFLAVTRLIEFGRHAAINRKQRGLGKPETFNFLGMTFISGKSRGGKFLLKPERVNDFETPFVMRLASKRV